MQMASVHEMLLLDSKDSSNFSSVRNSLSMRYRLVWLSALEEGSQVWGEIHDVARLEKLGSTFSLPADLSLQFFFASKEAF